MRRENAREKEEISATLQKVRLTGRVIMPAWQNRHPRVQPRKISTLSRSCTTSVSGTSWCFGVNRTLKRGMALTWC